MNRHQRNISKRNNAIIRLNDAARDLDKALRLAGVPSEDKQLFLNWAVASLWNTYTQERMNRRLLIEDEIRKLAIRLPNGTVGKEYEVSFHLPADKICNVILNGSEEIGLAFSYTDGECTLKGKPSKGGDFSLKLLYDTIQGEPTSELDLPVAFNPDPRTLWENRPTDPCIIYYKTDSDTQYIKVKVKEDQAQKKDLVAASQRGRSHAHEGKPRDDHFGIYHCADSDWYIMAVADGAGSAKYSRKGSEVACETVVEHCKGKLLHNPDFEAAILRYEADKDNQEKRTDLTRHVIDIIYNAAVKAYDAVKKMASANSETIIKDFATTLMFAVCKKYDFGWFIASFWVGDGAMCLFDEKNKTAKLLGTPDEGEFSGQTRFLTMPEIFRDPEVVRKRLRMAIVPDFTALFLMTDGVSDPMFETDKNLNDYAKWEEFYQKLRAGFPDDNISGVDLVDDNEESQNQLLSWLDFWSPGNHDDRTIAILY